MLNRDRLGEVISYNPETGIFTWIKSMGRARAGEIAGRKSKKGYLQIQIDGVQHLSHRLAWMYMVGSWPPHEIDHINRCRHDNRWANLRAATRSQNMQNLDAAGFYWNKKSKKWLSQIRADGKLLSIGMYDNIIDARAAYLRARRQRFGEFA